MTFAEFRTSLRLERPGGDLPPLLQALWFERRGNWEQAHRIAQDIEGEDAAWVHAYLHRREGDLSNADYWYRRAGRRPAAGTLDEEWQEIAIELLGR